jgi:putative xylitol transport system permease protein
VSSVTAPSLGENLRARISSPTTQKVIVNLLILLALWLVLSLTAHNFFDWRNAQNIMRQISVVAIVASAATLVMVGGGLDLSVGGIAAISGVGAALTATHGASTTTAFIVGGLIGVGVGLVNGLLIVSLGLNPVIATLGTLYVSRGAANLLSNGLPIYDVPTDWSALGTGFVLGLPTPAVILIVVVVVLWGVQRYTLLGKYAIAVGSNFEAARLTGIRVDRVRIGLYVISGAAAGLGGIVLTSILNSGQPTAGVGLEFDVIVAAILGGTSLTGGQGNVVGTLIGALIVGTVNNGLNLLGVQTFWQTIVQGLILVGAVALDVLVQRRRGRRYRPSLLRRSTA